MASEQNTEQNFTELKTARENLGLTLKDMYERTRISVANLEAIEKGDFHLLPVPIYGRNFIKTYADVLGVDSRPVLQRYENYLQAVQMKENAQIKEPSPGETVGSVVVRYRAYIWIFCIIVVFAAVSLFISFYKKPPAEVPLKTEVKKEAPAQEIQLPMTVQPENKPVIDLPPQPENTVPAQPAGAEKNLPGKQGQENKQETKPEAKPASAQIKQPAAPVEKPKSDAQKVQALVDSEESSVIVIRATEETWIRIKADDKEPFQVLLKEGEKISYKGARFQMDIGNAAGVKIQFNGKYFENLGKTGQVIHLRLP